MNKIQKVQSRARQRFFTAALRMCGICCGICCVAALMAITPALPNSVTPAANDALGETLLTFQTRQYSIRIFRQRGILRLNLYNRETDKVEQRGVPMRQTVTDTGIVYTNLQGETSYRVTVAPDGSAYELKLQQGDRITYSEQVPHERATSAAPPVQPAPQNPPTLTQPTRSTQPTRHPQQQASALQPIQDSETIARFQTPKYAVRIYSHADELRMNLYNRSTDKVELKAVPVKSTASSSSTTYSYPSGNFVYSATVMPIGGYRLVVTQGDRVIYNEQGY